MTADLKSIAGRGAPIRRSGKVFVMTVLGLPLLCSGCAFQRQAARIAIDHNEFVAQTTNRQTVLNILRASEREPMHFTSFASVGGRVQANGTLGINTAINGDGGSLTQTDTATTNAGPTGAVTGSTATRTLAEALTRGATNWTPSASVTVTTGTDFQIGVNATDDFYRGIMGQLSPGILVYYLRQNFPPDLLSYLVIGRIDYYAHITAPDGHEEVVLLKTIRNSPDEPAAPDDISFAAALQCRQLDTMLYHADATSLPVPLPDISGVTPEVLARLRAVPGQNGQFSYELATPARNEFRLALSPPNGDACGPLNLLLQQEFGKWVRDHQLAPRARPGAASGATAQVSPDSRALYGPPPTGSLTSESVISQSINGAGGIAFRSVGFFDNLLPEDYKSELSFDLTFRSVEGVLYYLGEYVRNEHPWPLLWGDHCPDGRPGYCLPIIRVRPASQIRPSDRFVDVMYRGRLYAVPLAGGHLNAESGRSSQSISLVQQLLNLHRSSKDLPSTPLVRIAN